MDGGFAGARLQAGSRTTKCLEAFGWWSVGELTLKCTTLRGAHETRTCDWGLELRGQETVEATHEARDHMNRDRLCTRPCARLRSRRGRE